MPRIIVALAGAGLLAGAVLWAPAASRAADPRTLSASDCLSEAQQRQAVSSGKAVTLAAAIRASKRRAPGEVVRAQLCRQGEGFVYVLTVLARNGKVSRALVDATDGALAGVH